MNKKNQNKYKNILEIIFAYVLIPICFGMLYLFIYGIYFLSFNGLAGLLASLLLDFNNFYKSYSVTLSSSISSMATFVKEAGLSFVIYMFLSSITGIWFYHINVGVNTIINSTESKNDLDAIDKFYYRAFRIFLLLTNIGFYFLYVRLQFFKIENIYLEFLTFQIIFYLSFKFPTWINNFFIYIGDKDKKL